MKNKILFFLFFTLVLQAQDKELHIEYNLNFIKPIDVKIQLYATKNESFQTILDKDPIIIKDINGNGEVKYSKVNPYRIYKNNKDSFMKYEEILPQNLGGKKFNIKDSLNLIKWELTQENETILGYSCQQAMASYRGRDYIAYFTTEIPYKAAPLKFHGLPGVVLKIHDSNNEINIEAISLKISTALIHERFFEDIEFTSWLAYEEIYKKRFKEVSEKQAQMIAKVMDKIKMQKPNAKPRASLPNIEIIIAENSNILK